MSIEYIINRSAVARQLHRSDLDQDILGGITDMTFFYEAATETINTRLGMDLIAPTDTNDANAVLLSHPALYKYGALVSAYEFINEVDMAQHFGARFEDEISRYYITDPAGSTPPLVMGYTAEELASESS